MIDPTRDLLKELLDKKEYRENDPIRNFLTMKCGSHSFKNVDGSTMKLPSGRDIKEPDQFACLDEIRAVHKEGYRSSADTLFAPWNTLTQAIYLSTKAIYRTHGDVYNLDSAKIDGKWQNGAKNSNYGVKLLLEKHKKGNYRETTGLFKEAVRLAYSPAGMMLMPVRKDGDNLNTVRADKNNDRDYFDRTLRSIRDGNYNEFFSGDQVAPRFRLEMDESGKPKPTPDAWERFLEVNHLKMCVNQDKDGEIKPLFDGEPNEHGLPPTIKDCRQWAERVVKIVTDRAAALRANRGRS